MVVCGKGDCFGRRGSVATQILKWVHCSSDISGELCCGMIVHSYRREFQVLEESQRIELASST
jgi:hypothetical protein